MIRLQNRIINLISPNELALINWESYCKNTDIEWDVISVARFWEYLIPLDILKNKSFQKSTEDFFEISNLDWSLLEKEVNRYESVFVFYTSILNLSKIDLKKNLDKLKLNIMDYTHIV